jgi:hypothetical protein
VRLIRGGIDRKGQTDLVAHRRDRGVVVCVRTRWNGSVADQEMRPEGGCVLYAHDRKVSAHFEGGWMCVGTVECMWCTGRDGSAASWHGLDVCGARNGMKR